MTLRGMTWDHPRAYRPLDAFTAASDGPSVHWDRQPLADFEARPIAALAADYDLLVIDHPGIGAAVARGALRPLEEIVPAGLLSDWKQRSVASTWASYRRDGRQWAVPIDAATQVLVYRPDLLDAVPRTWADVLDAAGRHRLALCLGGPHALLDVLGMAPGNDVAGELLDPERAVAAIELLREVYAYADPQLSLADPIAIHEALASRSDVAYCPLAYGYAGYARPAAGRHAVRWADAPAFEASRPASVLGGTGLAVSARRDVDLADVRAWLTGYLASGVQARLVADAGGQPAVRAAWDSPQLDADWGGYYTSTRRSLEHAHLRPSMDGWIPLQAAASELVREAIVSGAPAARVIAEVNDRFRSLTRAAVRAR